MRVKGWTLRMSLAGRLALAGAAFGLLLAGGAILLGCWALDQQLHRQGHAEHGTGDQGPDGPAGGLYDGKQIRAPGECHRSWWA